MIKVRRVDFSADEWIAGTLGMTLEEEGLYIKICGLIWSTGGRITAERLKACSTEHGNKINALLNRLEAAGKIVRNGLEIGQKRAEKELENARKRVGNALENGTKYRRHKGFPPKVAIATHKSVAPANHQPPTSKEEGLAPRANPVFLTARDASPPLPSQGDGGDALHAPITNEAEPEAPTVFDDPALKADAVAALDRCLDVLRGKAGPLDDVQAVATPPPRPPLPPPRPPPDPRIVEFRARLQRLNALAGRIADADTRLRAWDVIARADALGDPQALSLAMLADLAAIEGLQQQWAEAAE